PGCTTASSIGSESSSSTAAGLARPGCAAPIAGPGSLGRPSDGGGNRGVIIRAFSFLLFRLAFTPSSFLLRFLSLRFLSGLFPLRSPWRRYGRGAPSRRVTASCAVSSFRRERPAGAVGPRPYHNPGAAAGRLQPPAAWDGARDYVRRPLEHGPAWVRGEGGQGGGEG